MLFNILFVSLLVKLAKYLIPLSFLLALNLLNFSSLSSEYYKSFLLKYYKYDIATDIFYIVRFLLFFLYNYQLPRKTKC